MTNVKLLAAQYAKPSYKVRAMSSKKPSAKKGTGHSVRVLNLLGYMTK
jgi:hypothetical protein